MHYLSQTIQRSLYLKWGAIALSILFATVIAAVANTTLTHAANPVYGSCQSVSVPVKLSPGGSANKALSGTLCTPTNWASGPHQVDMLAHGGGYNREYWDWQVNPSLYSYVDKTLQAGRATLAYDRIGYGTSSHPLSTQLSIEVNAYTIHQLVQWLRNTQGFAEVNSIGHSIGSVSALKEAALYHDIDRLILTGLLHPTEPTSTTTIAGAIYPAFLDPAFAGKNLDAGYLTSVPGKRRALFYTPSADAAIVARDEATKDTFTPIELTGALAETALPAVLDTTTPAITVALLLVVGQNDALFCGPIAQCSSDAQVRAREAAYYPNASSLTAVVVPNTGHSLTGHQSANSSFMAIDNWIQSH